MAFGTSRRPEGHMVCLPFQCASFNMPPIQESGNGFGPFNTKSVNLVYSQGNAPRYRNSNITAVRAGRSKLMFWPSSVMVEAGTTCGVGP